MAAIQIARWRGARIIATAGSSAKRALLRAMGVDAVLDSRSTAFVDDIKGLTNGGVDVVLNSLAGEAMEASLECLAPFGRFVELGKRDYAANTHLGMRPFRKNLSYFGVDLDQLMAGRRPLGSAIFKTLMSLFEKRILTPLPHATYAAEAIGEALQAMQQSSHVGKIVVLAPDPSAHRRAPGEWRANAAGAHVITGAFGGFGVEIARWLVDRGARHLVLLGRRGATDDRSRALLDELAERGVDVVVAHCDVADFDDVTSLFERVARDMPPVVGVMHAAMVLDDGVIANLDAERFARVLAPKVDGAVNLDRATRDMRLDYFVLFSSVTTLIGNYGQGNYVAANAFMEGLARARRQRGLPALAVGWGAISDVGVAVSNETAQRNLRKLTRQLGKEGGEAMDVFGLRAREGLDLMARAMVEAEGSDDFAVITISRNDGGFRKDLLPVLRSPTFDGYVDGGEDGRDATEGLDLLALLRSEEIDVVRRRVTDVVVAQLAKVLHARPEELSRSRPLGEIGLDSLMTLELAMDIEKAVGASMSRMQSVGALTIQGLVDEIIAQAEGTSDLDDEPVEAGVSR